MLGALMSQLGAWLYSFAEQELTWRALLVYGFIFLMSWLFSKLFIFPSLSPLRKVSSCISLRVLLQFPFFLSSADWPLVFDLIVLA